MITNRLPNELKKYFVEEIMILIRKYNKFEEYQLQQIEDALRLMDKFEVELNVGSIDYLFEIVTLLANYKVEVVENYMWIEKGLGYKTSIEEAVANVNTIKEDGYVYQQDVIIYLDENNKELKRRLLEEMMCNNYDIDRLFDKDTLIDMWLEGTTKEEVIDDMVHSLSLEEIVDEYPQEAYITSDGTELKYIHVQ